MERYATYARPESRPISYTWRCPVCKRELHLSHKYKWLGEGKQRRRVCVECLAKMEVRCSSTQ